MSATRSSSKPTAPAAANAAATNGDSFGTTLKGIRQEFDKIQWPTGPQLWGNTVIVLIMVILVSVGLWGIDNIFRGIIWVLTEEIPKHLL